MTVLPKMKCPYLIEPHQIQGLDFIHIFPVIQWLVKRSVENRTEKAEKLKAFAVGQFHNHFSLKSDRDAKQKYINAVTCVKDVQDFYSPRRKYKRKDAGQEDEKTRVRVTLLEYGNKGKTQMASATGSKATPTAATKTDAEGIEGAGDVINAPNEVVRMFLKWHTFVIYCIRFCLIDSSKLLTSNHASLVITIYPALYSQMHAKVCTMSDRTKKNTHTYIIDFIILLCSLLRRSYTSD